MPTQQSPGRRHPVLITLSAAVLVSGMLAVSLLVAVAPARAGEHVYDITNKTYKGECSACHIAYPPQLLSAQSWRIIMAGLDKHFGSDASIDAGAAEELRRYLEQNAGRRRGLEGTPAQGPGAGATPRISTTDWFVKEHRKVVADFPSNKTIGSAANCAACHTRADQGDFSERSLRLPR